MDIETQSPIAIIGMACRFPGAADEQAYWELIARGGCAVSETPADRWPVADLFDSEVGAPGKVSTRHGGFLDRYAHFDADFFGIHAREARAMDPQQRVLLELTWHALENAAIDPRTLAGARGGVFIGASTWDYSKLMNRDLHVLDAYCGTGAVLSMIANRISYLLDLHGPSLVVDTACSSSLTALHLAAQSLERGECDIALVGAVNVMVSPETTITLSAAGSMSASGRCHSFAACADGIVRGEGAGVIVMRRLADAQAAADPILGVVRGSALNQDGRTNGLTAPNVFAQQALIREALARAGVKPSEPSYVEAHGTGTPLGDPIEVRALQKVLQEGRSADRPCFVGAVKANIGHCEAAAGLAGVIKVLLAFRHERIPPQPPLEAVNPHIASLLKEGTLQLATHAQPWPCGTTRIAAVSTLSFGGSNAHVVLQEPPLEAAVDRQSAPDPAYHVLKLSAESPAALAELASAFRSELLACAEDRSAVADFCYTANCFRSELRHRAVVAGSSAGELATALAELAADPPLSAARRRPKLALWVPELAFQPAAWNSVASALCDAEPIFREAFERCLALHPGDVLSAQARAFALQHALGRVVAAWGVAPTAAVGCGTGELVAAALSGALTLDRAFELALGRCPDSAQSGAPSALPEAVQRDTVIVLAPAAHCPQTSGDVRCLPVLADEPLHVRTQLSRALHELFAAGHALSWNAFYLGQARRRRRIPSYPFQGSRHWLPFTRRPIAMSVLPAGEHRPTRRAGLDVQALQHPLLGACVVLASGGQLVLTGRLARDEQAWLADHCIDGNAVVSSTTLLELALLGARKAGLECVRTLAIEAVFALPERGGVQVQLALGDSPEPGCRSVSVFVRAESSDPSQPWLRCAHGELGPSPRGAESPRPHATGAKHAIALDDVYHALASGGLTYGAAFRGLSSAQRADDTWFAELALPELALRDAEAYCLHPALLDSALHVVSAQAEPRALPRLFRGVSVRTPGAVRLHATLALTARGVKLVLCDERGEHVGTIDNVVLDVMQVVELAAGGSDSAETVAAASPPRLQAAKSAAAKAFKARLGALGTEERELALIEAVCDAIRTVLGTTSQDVDPSRPLAELGLDSRMALELRNQFTNLTGLKLSASLLFDYPTPAALARLLDLMLFNVSRATPAEKRERALAEKISAIPIARLREAGLLDALLQLAADHVQDRDRTCPMGDELARIDAMSPEELLQRARSQ